MKKVIALLLALTLVIGCLAACDKKDEPSNNTSGDNNTTNNTSDSTLATLLLLRRKSSLSRSTIRLLTIRVCRKAGSLR